MTLNQLLDPQNNNLDLFRVVAALLVIYGHAPAFIVDSAHTDIVYDLLKFDYSASLAVKFFFMLSGLLVTHSLLVRPKISSFLIRRVARIFPGLFVCVFLSVFVLGFIATNLPAVEYFLHPQTWRYWLNNSFLIGLQWELPGVFTTSRTSTVNGSLWTLPLEVMCYISLVCFYVLIVRRNARLACFILLLLISLIFFGSSLLPSGLARFNESLSLGGCFCIGVFAAISLQRLVFNEKGVVLCLVIVFLLWKTPLQKFAFYCGIFYICLYLSSTNLATRVLKFPGDPSYGIYIYGFVIQQCLAALFPTQGVIFHQVTALVIAIVVGFLSWYVVELPVIRQVRMLSKKKRPSEEGWRT